MFEHASTCRLQRFRATGFYARFLPEDPWLVRILRHRSLQFLLLQRFLQTNTLQLMDIFVVCGVLRTQGATNVDLQLAGDLN